MTWANEITWRVDDGEEFGIDPVFEDNQDYYMNMMLLPGRHNITVADAYGDGWHGG
eukprot:COSAG06_NODE_26686_length_609_cov_1.015686_2_plen_55_part_01